MDKFHLIGETVGGSISMRFATLHQERLHSLTACTSPTNFQDPHHAESADLIDREGVAAWVESTITRRLDPRYSGPGVYSVVRGANGRHPRQCCGRLSAPRRRGLGPVAERTSKRPPSSWLLKACGRRSWGTFAERRTCSPTPVGWYSRGSPGSSSTYFPFPAHGCGLTSPGV